MALPKTSAEMTAKQVPQGAVDPNVKIPQSVLDAGKRSEAIQHAIAGTSEPSVAAEIVEGQTPPPEGETPPPESQTPPPEGQTPPEDEQTWQQRYKSLTGRAEAEARRARDAVNSLSNRLEQLETENRLLKTAPAAQPNGEAHTPPAALTEQEINDYGPEFVDIMRRVSNETSAPLIEEINRLRSAMGHVQEETGNAFLQRMHGTLNGAVPDWAALNKDPRFITWSQLPDIFSGAIRKTLMQDAWNSGDPYRVAAFFQAYLAEEAATNPQGTGQRTLPPSRMVVSDTPISPATPGAPLDLTTLAAPGRAHSAGSSNPAEKPVYSAAEITKFYTDVAAGRWRGREAAQQAIDRDIILAQHEGRIIVDPRTQTPRDPHMR